MNSSVTPYSLKDAPALIERLLPVQKLSAEAYKEQEGRQSKTLTPLGSYWKGRKPLILNKACILGCLLPATEDSARDLDIFEKLMAMDDESFVIRWKRRPKPKEILGVLSIARIADYFTVEPEGVLPPSAPIDWSNQDYSSVSVSWRKNLLELERRRLEAQMLPRLPYRDRVTESRRPEEVMDAVHEHIWDEVNEHVGTSARSFAELVEQLGVMRFGHRPRVADTFCGSGQIPFEAARLGCDVYASDLNPMACMLTWGAFNIIGGSRDDRKRLERNQKELAQHILSKIDALGSEIDGAGWHAKVFVYCVEARCPQTGWIVPALPTLVVGKGYRIIAKLIPDYKRKRYEIAIRTGVTDQELKAAEIGTVRRDNRYGDAYLVHEVDGVSYKTKISTLRGDYEKTDGTIGNQLRLWDKLDVKPRPDDILQERLYCVQWMRAKPKGKSFDLEFRAVTSDDLRRESIVEEFITAHLADWQAKGYVPDMRIEVGGPPRYQGLDLVRGRGWTYWNHVFNPRQLLVAGLVNQFTDARLKPSLTQVLNVNSRLSGFDNSEGGAAATKGAFVNQALNTLYFYGARGAGFLIPALTQRYPSFPLPHLDRCIVENVPATTFHTDADVFVTDPPYGDAVKYEEILDFFIAWLRKNPPPELANWIWDSRRSLAIKGEGEDFRRGMVAAYKRMAECMPDNGMQIIMFTHQSGSIWADMANIVWASGLHVTAAWYVVTETDTALREGSYVKGTVLLVLRKRQGAHKTTRDDLAWEIQEEVEKQVADLTGLNQDAKSFYRDENVFEDADIQMAGYAAALRVLTRYAVIDGRDMTSEAIRPRVKGETTFVDGLIAFAVDTANQCLVPQGIPERHWKEYTGAERFYLKMLDLEAKGFKALDNYQNFAKAFKVRDFRALMASQKANEARLRSAVEFGKNEMSESSEFHQSVLRAVLYAVMELVSNMDGNEVLAHLTLNVPDYYSNQTQRERVVELADYLAKKVETLRPNEASAARILRDLVKNQRLG
jgi:putative DNA methylase